MTNFTAFNQPHLQKLIEPFLPGATDYITPVYYFAVTPDMFLFVFRTSKDDKDYFFASLETDYLEGEEVARQIVKKWLGADITETFSPADTDTKDEPSITTESPYKGFLFLITRPTNLGYWAEYLYVKKTDDLQKKLASFTPKQIKTVEQIFTSKDCEALLAYKNDQGNLEVFWNL